MIIVLSLSMIANVAMADVKESIFEKYKNKARDFVSEYISDDLAVKFFGEGTPQIALPQIPKIETNSKKGKEFDESKIGRPLSEKVNINQYNYEFVVELYDVVRSEKVDENTSAKWLNVLSQGGSREGVYHSIVLDEYYGGLENMETSINDGTIRFAVSFFEDYFRMTLKPASLEGLNFYTLKRELSEKILVLLDTFAEENPENIYKWYAVVSAGLAEDFQHVYKDKYRLNKDTNVHYAWAKSLPYQIVKLEMIIKLHKAMNSLN